MDYKMLHGGGSRAASSPSTAERAVSEGARGLRTVLPEGAFETVDKVEGRLVGAGERAPEALVEPALEALTSGGKRLRPLLLVLCSELAEIGDPRLVRAFSEASEGLAAGELEQYRANGATVQVEAYLEHIRKKTAGLFKAACVAGGTLGGLSLVQIDALASYGQALGIAFQMSDDIMDLVGKPGLMGKGIGTDLAEGTV